MNKTFAVGALAGILFADILTSQAWADLNASQIQISQPSSANTDAPGDMLLSLQAGQFKPASVQIDNGSYNFNYGNNIASVMGELGWAGRFIDSIGSVYFEENLMFSTFSGSVAQNTSSAQASLSSTAYSLYLFGFDSRLMYAADWFPVNWIIPFGDAGYQYSLYYQPSSSGLESSFGGVGNFVAGGGLRFWLNPKASVEKGKMPIYVSLKYNHIFDSASSLNLASSSVLAGVALGF